MMDQEKDPCATSAVCIRTVSDPENEKLVYQISGYFDWLGRMWLVTCSAWNSICPCERLIGIDGRLSSHQVCH